MAKAKVLSGLAHTSEVPVIATAADEKRARAQALKGLSAANPEEPTSVSLS